MPYFRQRYRASTLSEPLVLDYGPQKDVAIVESAKRGRFRLWRQLCHRSVGYGRGCAASQDRANSVDKGVMILTDTIMHYIRHQ